MLDTSPRQRRRSSLDWDCDQYLSNASVFLSDRVVIGGNAAFDDGVVGFVEAPPMPAHVAWGKLDVLASLDHGWNGHGAPAPTATAVATAKRVVQVLGMSTVVPMAVVPTNRGGVQLEWHARGLDIEIEVDRRGAVVVAVEDENGTFDADGSLAANWLVLSKALQELS